MSQHFGDMDGAFFCGERAYEIEEALPGFLDLDPDNRKLTLKADDEADVGEYTFTLRVYLYYFPQVEIKKTFRVSIKLCKITIATSANDILYTLGNPSLTSGFYEFTASEECPSA